jgi:two-component system, chemotaxis family, protein-glutamate methylesterase/glutaminase
MLRAEAIRQRQLCLQLRVRLNAAAEAARTSMMDSRTPVPHPNAKSNGWDGAAAAPAIVGFALSAGGLAPLRFVLSRLPSAFQAGVIVAQHTASGSALPLLLQLRSALRVKFAESGEPILRGVVYVCPPGRHVVANADHTLAVVEKGRLHFARPSADWLFESMAASYADASVAVILSGYQHDGARGVVPIHRAGGSVIVQDPETCEAHDMPEAAIRTGCATRILHPEQISCAIVDRLRLLELERLTREFEEPFSREAAF